MIDISTISILWYGGIKEGRKEKFLSNMKKLNLNVTHIEPIISYDPINSVRIGCGKSHVKALKKSLENDFPTLILEDDVNFTSYYKSKFEIPSDADAIYLGTCLNGLHKEWKNRHPNNACCGTPILLKKTNDYYKISGMLTTHAILYLNKKYKENCIDLIEKDDGNNHCDVLLASQMHKYNVYACKHPMFFQDCKDNNKDAYEKTITPLWSIFK